MKRFSGAWLLVGALLAAPVVTAQARTSVPIIERPNEPVTTGSGKAVNGQELRKAILSAGTAMKWEVIPSGDGKSLRGTLRVRNKHTIVVDIVPGPEAFSVKYVDSINMNYTVLDGAPVIHPNYNRWVDQLIQSIRVELKKL